jgi:hypothetical protein
MSEDFGDVRDDEPRPRPTPSHEPVRRHFCSGSAFNPVIVCWRLVVPHHAHHLAAVDVRQLALAAELRRTIAEDRYPLSPRVRTPQSILDKLDPRRPTIPRRR